MNEARRGKTWTRGSQGYMVLQPLVEASGEKREELLWRYLKGYLPESQTAEIESHVLNSYSFDATQ
jgi:hypothetical protein